MNGNGSSRAAAGLMAFWSNIDPADQLAFQQWHNCEHIPERVSIPGFLAGRRYRSTRDPNRFLMFYETRSAEVLTGAAYLAKLNAPTPWTRQALGWFRDPARSVYALQDVAGSARPWPAPVLVVIRFDPASGKTDPAAADIDAASLEALLADPHVSRARTYRAAGKASSPSTAEAAIHGARPSALEGLLIAESDELDLIARPDPRSRWSDRVRRIFAGSALADAELDVLWLEFALDSHAIPLADERSAARFSG